MPKKFRVLFLNQTLGVGGAEKVLNDLLNYLSRQRINVIAYSTNTRAYPKATQISLVVDLIGDWKGLIKGLALLPIAFVYYGYIVFSNRKVDVVFLSGFIEKILGSIWASWFSIPVVWEEFGPYGKLMTQFGGLTKVMYQLVTPIPRQVIVPSHHTAKWLIGQFPNLKEKVVIIALATPANAKKVTSGKDLVVCVSRLEKLKGQDNLITAWREVIDNVPGAKLKIIGEGDQLPVLKQLAAELNISKSVRLTGWVKDSKAEMAKSEMVVFPTVWPLEGFGMVAIEAMSESKPVVALNFGPVPEVVDSKTGILVPAGDNHALAQAIIKLLQDKSFARKLGKNGYAKWKQKFTWQVSGPKYLQVFMQACAN